MSEFAGDRAAAEGQPRFDHYFVAAATRIEPSAAQRAGYAQPAVQLAHPGRTSRRRATPASQVWLVILVVVATAVALVLMRTGGRAVASVGEGDGVFGVVTASPPVLDSPHPVRVLAAPAPVPGEGGYTVLDQRSGTPVTWDPCLPIHFVVRSSGEIPGGQVLLDRAIAEISKDTGLFFEDDGTTTEVPSSSRNPYQPDRYGKTWAPVLIAWSNSTEYPALAGDVIGLAGPIAVGGKDARIVSGEVVFDAPDLTKVETLPDGATYAYDVLLHELGHLVGLGHVPDPNSIMNPVSTRPLPGYSTGDLRGLAVLGSGRCPTKV
jgi:Matrixin